MPGADDTDTPPVPVKGALPLSSMTAFARHEGLSDAARWVWEIKSVNNRGFDTRFRLPPGFDQLEAPLRARAAKKLSRGGVSISLALQRSEGESRLCVNEDLLEEAVSLSRAIARRIGAAEMTMGELFAIKGVLTSPEKPALDGVGGELKSPLLASFEKALADHVSERQREGMALGQALLRQLEHITGLVSRAKEAATAVPALVQTRLETALKALHAEGVEPGRLAQEVAMIAAKADIQEELDRLHVHCMAARALLVTGGVVGRAFDFLTQELNRETNTLCSKAQTQDLKEIGLELKGLIDQMREQIQNIE